MSSVTLSKHKSVTENRLYEIVSDHHDIIRIISQCPKCLQAYKKLIQKKKAPFYTANLQEGGLTGSNSQQETIQIAKR